MNDTTPGMDAHARFDLTVNATGRMLSAVAHQTGAVMLPTLRDDPALAEHRAWKRLSFVASAMTDHIRGQKFALDQLRGAPDPGTPTMDAAAWTSWLPSLLEGLAAKGRMSASFELEGEISPQLARALALLWIWIDVQSEGAAPVTVAVRGGAGKYVAAAHPMPAAAEDVPAALSDAWSALGEVSVSHDGGAELTLAAG